MLIVGGGDGATTTDGEIPRRIEPDRLVLVNFGLATITGLLIVVAAAFALENTLESRGRRGVVAVAPAGDGDRIVEPAGFGVGNLAVTAEDDFRVG